MKKKVLHPAIAIALSMPVLGMSVNAAVNSGVKDSTALRQLTQLDVTRVPVVNRIQEASFGTLAQMSQQQAQAMAEFSAANPNARLSLNQMTGTLDTITGIGIQTQGDTAEAMGRYFLERHGDLFDGLNIDQLHFNSARSKPALGGQLVRFDQQLNGIKVEGNGIGLVIDADNRVRAVMGPYLKTLEANTVPGIGSDAAIVNADQDLKQFKRQLPAEALTLLQPAFAKVAEQLGPFSTPIPELRLVETASGLTLAWQFYYFSTNPFGVFKYLIAADSGQVLLREDQVRLAEEVEATAQFADYFPTFPPITRALQDECTLLDDEGGEVGKPAGMLRIKLRKFDDTNRLTGVEGALTGKHAHIENALPTKLPFGQAALGSYYFDEDAPPLKARPNEKDHLAEPAEHLDGISQFIYITSLLEYLDYLHKDGDAVHSRGLGEGSFPNKYPNESVPLVGVVHIPNVLDAPTDTADPEFLAKLMGLDNAFAIPLSQEINGQEVVVNPTFYGHGYLMNNLAIDFSVPMHEGTHATITPIAGFEGGPEGGALNEGQADLWAYTIGETPDLGTYPVNSCDLRRLLADNNVDPDSFEYIRSGQSQIRYSQLGTRNNEFEVHRDGEIYAGAMWDLREIMLGIYPQAGFNRPDPVTGEATQVTSLGKETWERIFLGSMYVLGVSAPDTFVKARDAALVADAILYPDNPMDVHSLGRHHALIERVFAARELGANAQAPLAGVQMISTAVSQFTAQQAGPATPQNIVADIVDPDTIRVSWDKVEGAVGYQVLKRKGGSPARLFGGVPGREYIDGDLQTNGYTHVEFVMGNKDYYRDRGQGLGRGSGQGLDALDYQYVVRAMAVNASGQVGFSDLSATAKTILKPTNVTKSLEARIGNLSFFQGKFALDQTLTSKSDVDLFGPIDFDIVKISSPNVTVANADNGGTGQTGKMARFVYDQHLTPGMTSAPRRLVFNNPLAELFTFKAKIKARVEQEPIAANGSQAAFDTSEPAVRQQVYHAISEHKGTVLLGSTEQTLVDGVDYVDVHFSARNSASSVVATLTADPQVAGAYPDLDLLLLDANGNTLASSGNLGSSEQVGATIVGGQSYILRVNGYANAPTQFNIVIDQMVSDPADATQTEASNDVTGVDTQLLEFIVNPVSGVVQTRLL